MLTAFLIVVSSALTLNSALTNSTTEITSVYINVAAMACLVVVVTMLNLQKNNQKNKLDV